MAEHRRLRISSGSPWESRAGYSRALRAGRHVYVSGTVGRNEDGSVPPSAYEQARRSLEIIAEALRQAGAAISDVVRTRTFVTDIALFDEVARAHSEVFGEVRPATSMVEVSRLVEDAYLLEIEADALLD